MHLPWPVISGALLLMLLLVLALVMIRTAWMSQARVAHLHQQLSLQRLTELTQLKGEHARLWNRHDALVDRICQMQQSGMVWVDNETPDPRQV